MSEEVDKQEKTSCLPLESGFRLNVFRMDPPKEVERTQVQVITGEIRSLLSQDWERHSLLRVGRVMPMTTSSLAEIVEDKKTLGHKVPE